MTASTRTETPDQAVLRHVREWSRLEGGDHVQAYRNGHLLASGDVYDLMPEGRMLWLIQDQGLGRILISKSDGAEIFRDNP